MIEIRTLEEHKKLLESVFSGKGFLRPDRGDALFVSDAPRRGTEITELPAGYKAVICNGIMKIYPEADTTRELTSLYIAVVKADEATAERLLRQALAVSMRKKDLKACEFIRELGSISKIYL